MREAAMAVVASAAGAVLQVEWGTILVSIVVYVVTRHIITPMFQALAQLVRARASKSEHLAEMAAVVQRELVDGGDGTLKHDVKAIRRTQEDEIVRHDNDVADLWSGLSRLGVDRRQHD